MDLEGRSQLWQMAPVPRHPQLIVAISGSWLAKDEDRDVRPEYAVNFLIDAAEGKVLQKTTPVAVEYAHTQLIGVPAPWDQSALITLGPGKSFRLLKVETTAEE